MTLEICCMFAADENRQENITADRKTQAIADIRQAGKKGRHGGEKGSSISSRSLCKRKRLTNRGNKTLKLRLVLRKSRRKEFAEKRSETRTMYRKTRRHGELVSNETTQRAA